MGHFQQGPFSVESLSYCNRISWNQTETTSLLSRLGGFFLHQSAIAVLCLKKVASEKTVVFLGCSKYCTRIHRPFPTTRKTKTSDLCLLLLSSRTCFLPPHTHTAYVCLLRSYQIEAEGEPFLFAHQTLITGSSGVGWHTTATSRQKTICGGGVGRTLFTHKSHYHNADLQRERYPLTGSG